MIFVLLTDENTLVVHDDEASAIRSCEGIDVEDGVCLFFDDAGQPFEPVFDEPNQRGRFMVVSGRYHLRQASESSRKTLLQLLPDVMNIEGPPTLTIGEVERLLSARSTHSARKSGAHGSP
jgi:hypothetical protein